MQVVSARGYRDRDVGLTGGTRVDSREMRGLCILYASSIRLTHLSSGMLSILRA